MFGLRINKENMPLPADTIFPIRATNPYFYDDGTLNKGSLPVTLFRDNLIWKVLNYPDNPMVIKSFTPIDCEILVGSALWKMKLETLKANNKKAEVFVFDGFFLETEGFMEKSIRDLVDEEIEIVPAPVVFFTFNCTGIITADTYHFSFNETTFSYVADGSESLNDILNEFATLINADTDIGYTALVSGDSLTITQIAPGPTCTAIFPNPVINWDDDGAIAASYDPFLWLKNYHDDLAAALYAIASTTDPWYPNVDYMFPTKYNENFYGGANEEFTNYINYWDNQTADYLLNYTNSESYDGNKYTLVPHVYIKKIWDLIWAESNLIIKGELQNRTGFLQAMFDNTFSLDHSLSQPRADLPAVLVFNNVINYKNHIPDMTVREYIQAISDTWNVKYILDRQLGTVTVSYRNLLPAKTARKDWRSRGWVEEPFIIPNNKNGVTFTSNMDNSDEYPQAYADQEGQFSLGDKYVYGNGETEHFSDFSRPSMIVQEQLLPGTETTLWRIPIARQVGTSLAFGTEGSFSARIIFFRGFQEDNNSNVYPYASIDKFNSLQTAEDEDLSMVWAELYQDFWDDWTIWNDNTITIDGNIALCAEDFLQIIWEEKLMIGFDDWQIDAFCEWLELAEVVGNDIICRISFLTKAPTL